MTITILKACVAFYSFIILKRLDKNNLDNFRTIEKLCKKYISILWATNVNFNEHICTFSSVCPHWFVLVASPGGIRLYGFCRKESQKYLKIARRK